MELKAVCMRRVQEMFLEKKLSVWETNEDESEDFGFLNVTCRYQEKIIL